MSTHKHFDKICCVVLAVTLLLTVLFMNAERFGMQKVSATMEYENKLFDSSTVHTIDIVMDDWDDFTANCKSEEYYACSVVIDNEAYKNVAIRGKGNTSLTQVESYGNDRYSFKIEFDHYDSTKTYYGLDKLCLNNIIQDNTYMKDYLTYQMMNEMGVASPLCSYVYITVNGEDWGLYLAVEGVEESFLQRNYGKDYGELYKPDSTSMGGGRGNGEKFDMDEFLGNTESEDTDATQYNNNSASPQMPNETANGDTNHSNQASDERMPSGQIPNGMQGGQTQDSDLQSNPSTNGMPGGQIPNGIPGGQTQNSDLQSNPSTNGIPSGQFPNGNQGGFDGGQLPDSMTPPGEGGNTDSSGQLPDSMTPPDSLELPDNMEIPEGIQDNVPGGMGGGMTNGSDDVLLKYIDDDTDSYSNIFDNAKTDISEADKSRLIQSLKKLSNGEDLENTVDIERVIRYFVVHNFVLNFDSYTGSMIHNYYLYENDGQMQMIPWDYNLAFGGFQSMGDATSLVNYPIDSPVSSGSTEDRPMIAWIFENEEYTELYHQYFAEFIAEYFDSGYFTEMIDRVNAMISPYVEKDPTKFCTYEEFETGIATLKEFCLLRAESISGQLDGTIGSTSDTQQSDTLIEAGELQINDMGSMGNMGGGMQTGADRQNQEENTVSNEMPQLPDKRENAQQGNSNNDQMQPPDEDAQPNKNSQMHPQEHGGLSASVWIAVAFSLVFLTFGLVFAVRFKRRKYKGSIH